MTRRVAAVACAVAVAVAAGWSLRARRRAAASLRGGRLLVADTLDSASCGDDSCDAPGLTDAFQVRRACALECADQMQPRCRRQQVARPPCTARTSSACCSTRSTSRRRWASAPPRRPRASTSLPTPSGACCRLRALCAQRMTPPLHAQRRSWRQVTGLSRQSAMTSYIALIGQLTEHQVCFSDLCAWCFPPLTQRSRSLSYQHTAQANKHTGSRSAASFGACALKISARASP